MFFYWPAVLELIHITLGSPKSIPKRNLCNNTVTGWMSPYTTRPSVKVLGDSYVIRSVVTGPLWISSRLPPISFHTRADWWIVLCFRTDLWNSETSIKTRVPRGTFWRVSLLQNIQEPILCLQLQNAAACGGRCHVPHPKLTLSTLLGDFHPQTPVKSGDGSPHTPVKSAARGVLDF